MRRTMRLTPEMSLLVAVSQQEVLLVLQVVGCKVADIVPYRLHMVLVRRVLPGLRTQF